MNKAKEHSASFDEVQGSIVYEEDCIDQKPLHRDSITEIPAKQLSGDEALEKSYMQSSGQSSIWEKKGQKTSIFLTSIIVMKSMVGVGILGVPYVASNFGAIITIIILCIIFIIGMSSSKLLLKCKNLSKRSNYSTIGFFIFKHKWIIILINIMIIIQNLGVSMSELMIFGDTSSNLVDYFTNTNEQPFYYSRSMLILIISLILIPFICVKTIEKLRFVSLFAILSIIAFSLMVIYNFFLVEETGPGFSWGIPDDFDIKRALASLPTLILAYNWQFNLFPIYKGMQSPSDKNLMVSALLGFILGTILYVIVGILGYATYGNKISTNYLLSIDESTVGAGLYIILNLSFVFSTTFTLPLMFFGGRNNFIQLLKQLKSNSKVTIQKNKQQLLENGDTTQYYYDQLQMKKRAQAISFYSISLLLFALISVGAIFIRNLGTIFNLVGSISCNQVQLGLPSLFYLCLVRQVKKKNFRSNQDKIIFYIVHGIFIISVCLTFLCIACEFLSKEKE